jgi:hypothetical protein
MHGVQGFLGGTLGCLIYRLSHQTEVGYPDPEIASQTKKGKYLRLSRRDRKQG